MGGDAEGERLAGTPLLGEGTEQGGIARAGLPECAGKGHSVAVEVENKSGEDFGGGATEAEVSGPEHRGRGVRGVEFAVDNFFAKGGPTDLAAEIDAESVLGEEAEVLGHGERGGVGEGHKA